jgi:hypothetical protein
MTRARRRTHARIGPMKPLNRDQAIWLARGAALGTFLTRVLHALRAGASGLRDDGRARRALPRRL